MPKQIGVHRIVGTTGKMTYSKTRDGFQAREKTVVNVDKMKKSPSYARVLENNAHFAEAGKASKLFRSAFIGLVKTCADSRLTSRVTTRMLQVVNSDATSERGKRKVTKGDMQLLKDLELNVGLSFTNALHTPYTVAFDRATGLYTVTINRSEQGFDASLTTGATHFRILAAVAELDFDNQTKISDLKASEDFEGSILSSESITLSPKVTPASTLPQILVLGVQFFMQEHGKSYFLPKDFNAAAIVQVNMPA